MSSSDEKEYSPNENDGSDDAFQFQFEEFDRNPARTTKENLPFGEELASVSQHIPSPKSVKVSYQLSNQSPTPSSQAPNIDQLDENCSSANVYFSPELRNRTNSIWGEDAVVSPQLNQTTSSISVLKDSHVSEAKTIQRNPLPFPANRKTDFSSPPDRDPVPVIRSLSKCLKETNTPSPEKRSVETDEGSTPIKRLRKTPESDPGKHGSKTESYRSKLSLSAATKTSYKSPTNLHLQELKIEVQKNEESESLNSPSTPSKRKRNDSSESKIANDLCLSHLIPPPSAANTVRVSPTNPLTLESKVAVRDVDEYDTERKILISFQDCLADSNSLAKHSNPDDLVQTASFLTLPMEERESNAAKESTDASSDNPNLKIRKQKDIQSTLDVLDAGALPNFTSKKHDNIMHLSPLRDTPLHKSNSVLGKQRDRQRVSDVSFEVVKPYLPVYETESAVHPLRLTDENYSSYHGPASESKNYTSGDLGSCIEIKKLQCSSSVPAEEKVSSSNMADSAIESQLLKSSLSRLKILNPHFFSCHLPRRNYSLVPVVPNRLSEFDVCDEKERIDQNRSDSSIRTSTLQRKSRSQPKELSVIERRMHRRSFSDETLTSRNLPEVLSEGYQLNNLQGMLTRSQLNESPTCNLGMRRRSVSDETLTSRNLPEVPADRYQSNVLQGMFTESQSNESSTLYGLGMRRRSASEKSSTSRNLTDVSVQQYQPNSLINSQSKETPMSKSIPEISKGVSRTTCVVHPLIQRIPARSASNATSAPTNPLELTIESESSLSDQPSTSRNNPEVQVQPYNNITLPQRIVQRFLSGQASTSRNQREVVSDINSPNIDEHEGQTSTASDQPIITAGSFFYDEFYFPTSRNEPATERRESDSRHLIALEGVSSILGYQPMFTSTYVSSDELDSASDNLTSVSDVSQPGVARERTRGTLETPPPLRRHAEFIAQAQFLLQSVLMEMMQYNEEDILWRRFETAFLGISESSSELDAMNLHSNLMCYLANKGYGLWNQNFFRTRERTAETRTLVYYELLLSMVVSALAFTLKEAKTHDFAAFKHIYLGFKSLYRRYVLFCGIFNEEDLQDEVSRNRVKERMKKIQSLLLRTLFPFRLLLMYFGENSTEELIQLMETLLSEEDRMFIRSRPR